MAENFASVMMVVAIVACCISMLMAIIRAGLGKTAFDRLLAVNAVGTVIIIGIALHGFILGRPEFIDISILYAVINFIGTFAVLKLFSTGTLGDGKGRAKANAGIGGGEEK